MIVAWTGHRPDVFREPAAAQAALDTVGRELIANGADRFLVGGQRGVDTWAARGAIENGIPFQLVLPAPVVDFTRDWSAADRAALADLVLKAETVEIAGGYRQRNLALVNGAQLLVAVWTRTAGGGTAETIELAHQAGVPVREILLEPSASAATAQGRGI